MIRQALLLSLIAVSLGACAGAPDEEETEASQDELRHGNVTREHPEVGQLVIGKGACTATLVGPRAAITAGHCVRFTTEAIGGAAKGKLRLDDGTRFHDYVVDGYKSFGKAAGDDDVALVHLATTVLPSVATPAQLANKRPAKGSQVAVYGYGGESCRFTRTDRIDTGRYGVKRAFLFAYGTNPRALCGGDSGGPITVKDAVFAVNSATTLPAGNDVTAYIDDQYKDLMAQIRTWEPPPEPGAGTEQDGPPAPAATTAPPAAAAPEQPDDVMPPDLGAGDGSGGCAVGTIAAADVDGAAGARSTSALGGILLGAAAMLRRRRRSVTATRQGPRRST
jgi:V8-like Glu-specific endopeptidase